MFENLKFTVVEDKDADREEVLNCLASAKFDPKNLIGPLPATYDEALELISANASELDIVFLDLNIPRNQRDYRPEKGHGHRLLKYIHDDLNTRPETHIRVVIVSGEDLLDGVSDDLLYRSFRGTLASVAQKASLEKTLKSSLKRLKRDPLLNRIRALGLNVTAEYESVFDGSQPIIERLEAARRLAIQLVRNEVEHFNGKTGTTNDYVDDLNGLIKDFIEARFDLDEKGRRRVKASKLTTPSGWGGFLWRGTMVQHLYAINAYRNLYTHIQEQPFDCIDEKQQTWKIPRDVLGDLRGGSSVGQIISVITKDLLHWYLPWHEEVFMPWRQGQEKA